VITGIVFLVNPDWFASGHARVRCPSPRSVVAVESQTEGDDEAGKQASVSLFD
jgi:hypothetical protein